MHNKNEPVRRESVPSLPIGNKNRLLCISGGHIIPPVKWAHLLLFARASIANWVTKKRIRLGGNANGL